MCVIYPLCAKISTGRLNICQCPTQLWNPKPSNATDFNQVWVNNFKYSDPTSAISFSFAGL